jgi:hypothetical protein
VVEEAEEEDEDEEEPEDLRMNSGSLGGCGSFTCGHLAARGGLLVRFEGVAGVAIARAGLAWW